MWPSDEDLRAAWAALVADPTTNGEFAVLVLVPLIQALTAQHRDADPQRIDTAAGDALLEFFKNAARFDPARGGLRGYLLMAANGDLRNLQAAERRHHRGRNPSDVVELDPAARNEEESDLPAWDSPEFQAVLVTLDESERRVLELQRGGERRTAVFAVELNLTHLPATEQADEVKRVKDRAMKKLQRALRVPI